VLVLRTGSNYTRQPDGAQPVLREFTPGGAAAAFEAAYRVAAPVVQAITAGWDRYATALPQGKL
jgi:purine nucleoside permease